MDLAFEWDSQKDLANLSKHGISFAEARSVFSDPLARIVPDLAHSRYEDREIIIGHSRTKRLLFVSFVHRSGGQIRIISARRATRREQYDYENNSPF